MASKKFLIDREPSYQMILDIMAMAEYELHRTIDGERADCIARKILAKAKERDDLNRVPTKTLAKLLDECE